MDSVIPDYIRECVRSLPPLPAAVERLMSLAKQPDADFKQIAQVVESDQTLTAKVLRVANSAFYGTSRQVQTIRQATVLLGSDAIFNIALSTSAMNVQRSIAEEWPIDADAFWRHNIGVAIAARRMAKALRIEKPEEAFVAGLLHDIGKLILLTHFGQTYADVLTRSQEDGTPLHVIEQEELDTNHTVAGHALCLHWKIPSPLAQGVAQHHDESLPAVTSLEAVVRNANDLTKTIRIGRSGNECVQLRDPQHLPQNRIGAQQLRQIILELPAEVDDAAEVFGASSGVVKRRDLPSNAQRPIVHLRIEAEAVASFFRSLLWSMGYEPIYAGKESEEAPSEGPLAGLITDQTLTGPLLLAYQRREIPILDFQAWCEANDQPRGDMLNARSVAQWVEDALPVMSAA